MIVRASVLLLRARRAERLLVNPSNPSNPSNEPDPIPPGAALGVLLSTDLRLSLLGPVQLADAGRQHVAQFRRGRRPLRELAEGTEGFADRLDVFVDFVVVGITAQLGEDLSGQERL